MKINFYRDNEQKAMTVEFFLFTKERVSIMNGEFVENEGQFYQVNSQLIAQQPGANHNAFIYPVDFERFQPK